MTEQEARDLARRLADGSDVFDLGLALEFVKFDPAAAENLIQAREDIRKRQEERDRARERRNRALIEEFG